MIFRYSTKIFSLINCAAAVSALFLFVFVSDAGAQEVINLDAKNLRASAAVSFSPQAGSFTEGSTFDIPILMNTRGNSVNAIELTIQFDPRTLAIVNPSGGKSIVGIWVEPPSYDNSKGTVRFAGMIPGGIVANSGLIGTLTFQAKGSGQTIVTVSNNSSVFLNDGLGTQISPDTVRGVYTLLPQAPEGARVYSDTHPFQSNWYRNNNPMVSWEREADVDGFSYAFDDKPATLPENKIVTTDTSKAYENVPDGVHYFHIMPIKKGIWGSVTNFQIRIDTSPPAQFTPQVDFLLATVVQRALISFVTTDALSGIDHYEVGVINKEDSTTNSPVFIRSESPYQVPFDTVKNVRVIVRAFDAAGNTRDAFIDVAQPFVLTKLLNDYKDIILTGLLLITFLALLVHYLFSHHILRRVKHSLDRAEKSDVRVDVPRPPNLDTGNTGQQEP